MMNWGDYGWGMGFGWIFKILFWALIIFGIAFIIRAFSLRPGKLVRKRRPSAF